MGTGDETGRTADGVAYENTADRAWARRAVDLYQRHELRMKTFNTDGVISAHVWGPCPRCGHALDARPTLSATVPGLRDITVGGTRWDRLIRRDAGARKPPMPESVDVSCGCGHAHPGAPDDVRGCGLSFRLPTAPPPPGAAQGSP